MTMIFTDQLLHQDQLIEQLQAQIAEAAAKKQRLQELERIATLALDALKDTVAQFKDGEPDALASLKAAVEELFDEEEVTPEGVNEKRGGETSKQTRRRGDAETRRMEIPPKISLTPPFDQQYIDSLPEVDEEELEKFRKRVCELDEEELTGQSTHISCLLWEDAPLQGQSCPWDFDWEWSDPDGSSWEIACPIACLLEDAPVSVTAVSENVQNQSPVTEPHPYMKLVKVSDRVSYQRKYDGEIQVTYAGFPNWNECRKMISQLKVLNLKFEKRKDEKKKPTRTGFLWELKIWGMSINQIQRMSSEMVGDEVSTEELKASIDPVAAETAEFLARSDQRMQEILDGKRPMPAINERGVSQLSWNQNKSDLLRQQTLDKTAAIAFFKQNNIPPSQWQARYEEMQAAAS